MSDERWIVIRNWNKFQHYRDRRPPWIKHYLELLADPNYLRLTLAQRGLLAGVWLMYAESRASVMLDTSWLRARLNGRVTMRDLEALNHAGFIEFSASKPLAARYQDAPLSRAHGETETETEKERSSSSENLLPLTETRTEGERQEVQNSEKQEQELDEEEPLEDRSKDLAELMQGLADGMGDPWKDWR